MGSNHMNKQFGKTKYLIPEFDPQTGEKNPYYEELTGNKPPTCEVNKNNDLDELNKFLRDIADLDVGIRRKIVKIRTYLDVISNKNKED